MNDMEQAWTAPSLPQADSDPGNPSSQYLTIDTIYGISGETLRCEVPISAGMAVGDYIRVRGRIGQVIYDDIERRLDSLQRPLLTAIPKFMLYGSAGNVMDLNFALCTGAEGWRISQSRNIRVQSPAMVLERPSLPQGTRTLRISYTNIAAGQRVRARLYSGPTTYVDTKEVTVPAGSRSVSITIDENWFRQNRGRKVWLNYAVLRPADTRRVISQVLYIERLERPWQGWSLSGRVILTRILRWLRATR